MLRKYHILVAEDSPALQLLLNTTLKRAGYQVTLTGNGAEALLTYEEHDPHLIILDLLLPGMDGLTFCKHVRQRSMVPILVVSSLSGNQHKLKAFEAGADDYLSKPYCPEELLLRVQSLLRRSYCNGQQPSGNGIWRCGNVEVDFTNRCLRRNGEEVLLTRTEWALLDELVRNSGRVLTHEELLQRVWGKTYGNETEYLRVYIGRLRRKLGDDPRKPRYVITHPGVGYRLVDWRSR